MTRAWASATRLRTPPDRVPTSDLRVQVQPVQGFVQPLLPGPAVLGFDAALQRVQVAFVARVLVDQFQHAGQAFANGVEHRRLGREHRLLRDVGDLQALLQLQDAVVHAFEAGEDLQQRGLARAVAADQADALGRFERELGVVKKGNVPESKLCIEECEERHRARDYPGTVASCRPGALWRCWL